MTRKQTHIPLLRRTGDLLLAALVAAGTPTAFGAEIVRVIPEFREEESFHRIVEYFTGREFTGRRIIVRTDEDNREGFYLTVRLRGVDRDALRRGMARIEAAFQEEYEARTYEFSLESVDRRRPLLLLGITGDDWPDEEERPLAWRVSFENEQGELLDTEQSFLWSLDRKEQ